MSKLVLIVDADRLIVGRVFTVLIQKALSYVPHFLIPHFDNSLIARKGFKEEFVLRQFWIILKQILLLIAKAIKVRVKARFKGKRQFLGQGGVEKQRDTMPANAKVNQSSHTNLDFVCSYKT